MLSQWQDMNLHNFVICFLSGSRSFKKQVLCSLLVCYQIVGGPYDRWMGSRHLVLKYAFSQLDCYVASVVFVYLCIFSSLSQFWMDTRYYEHDYYSVIKDPMKEVSILMPSFLRWTDQSFELLEPLKRFKAQHLVRTQAGGASPHMVKEFFLLVPQMPTMFLVTNPRPHLT